MPDISDMSFAIVPKSDQLNSEQLLSGPMTITVTDVSIGSVEQPISINYEGDNGRPYKPCLTMRKVLMLAWSPDGRTWPGKSMTLFNDPAVRFGGMNVGGIPFADSPHGFGVVVALVLTVTLLAGWFAFKDRD